MRLRNTWLALALLAAMPTAVAVHGANLTLVRNHSDDSCTSGYLLVSGQVVAYALERPWQGNQPFISSIPPGTYPVAVRLRDNGTWRLQLSGVPGRDYVQIHVGTTTNNTEGCILVGAGISSDLCSLSDSSGAFRRLGSLLFGAAAPTADADTAMTLTIVDDRVSFEGRWFGDCANSTAKAGADLQVKRSGTTHTGTLRLTYEAETAEYTIAPFTPDSAAKRGSMTGLSGEDRLTLDCKLENQLLSCSARDQGGLTVNCSLRRLR